MSVTSIQFIGLFVVLMNSGSGLHILLPHFPGTPYADHTSVIQYNPDQISSSTWPGVTNCGPDDSLRCAPIDVETITFSGATDPSPTDIVGDISHLRCCCSSMTYLRSKYRNPNATGKLSAHIFVTQGVAEAIAAGNGRVDTWVTMHTSDPDGITVTGTASASSFNIVFKPGAQFEILNSMPPTSAPHFLAYYLMGVGSSTCTAVPSDGPPCAPSAPECVTSANKTARGLKRRLVAVRRITPGPAIPLEVDTDCSNSHWP
jgi:hypothetical protein